MDLEGTDRGLIEVFSRHLPGWIEENYENLIEDTQDLNREHPE
jgi:hypothetical protein